MERRTECTKSELDLFTVPPVNTAMERATTVNFLPVATIMDDSPIEFHINSSSEEYIDLGKTYLFLKVQIVNKDGTPLAPDAKVAPVNLFMHSLFSQVNIHLRDTLITPSANTYPYKAYFESLLSYGQDAKETQLTSELWFMDEKNMDDHDPYSTVNDYIHNKGMVSRSKYISKSKTLEMMGRLHADIFHQDRYLLNGVDMHIKLIRSAPTFHLIADNDSYVTKIKEAMLFVRKVKVNPAIAITHSKMLDQGKFVKYPMRRGVVSSFTISQNSLSFTKENVISGQLPRRILIAFCRNSSYNGFIKRNPFNFEHFNLSYLSLSAGSQIYPSQPLKPNFNEKQYLQAYMTLFDGMGILNCDTGHCIQRDHFENGYAIYVFDLTPDQCDGEYVDNIKFGNIRLEAHFAAQLPCTINAVIYSEYDNLLQIDRARNIVTDF